MRKKRVKIFCTIRDARDKRKLWPQNKTLDMFYESEVLATSGDSDSARKWTKIGESVVELTKRGRVHLWKGDKGWQSLIKETKITRRYKML